VTDAGGGPDAVRRAEAAVEEFLAGAELDAEQVDEHTWYTMLSGERKKTVPVYLEVSERHLGVQSFFMRAPDENEAALYRYLLGRHLRSYIHRFAVAEDGDLLIVGVVPLAAVTVAELDRVLGQLLSLADEAFDTALRLGFASYIEREQDWRGRAGLARNPIT
jgi:hypothetical protein